ncbi:MAG: hypothetical protein M3P14_02400 [Chloroflexota bacterium]|nr:hypothetical protein [Chloroflexota bacterium]
MFSWRDAVVAVLVIAAAFVFAAFSGGWALPALADARFATLVIGVLCLAGCIVGGNTVSSLRGPFTRSASLLGSVALGLTIVGMVTAWQLAPGLLVADLVVLWTMATTRHVLAAERSAHHA